MADSRNIGECVTHLSGKEVTVVCECCTKYTEWKKKHHDAAEVLQRIADTPCYYKVCNESVTIGHHYLQHDHLCIAFSSTGSLQRHSSKIRAPRIHL